MHIIKTLILSANIGTLFEETHLIPGWIEEIEKIVLQYAPHFIAFSFQELGGKDSVNLHHIQFFCDQLDLIFKKEQETNANSLVANSYFSTGLIYEPDVKSSQFTAMGNLFLIHRDLLDTNLVQVWDRSEQVFKPIQFHNSNQLQIINANECNFIFHQRFPNRKSRKGWLHSRWKFGKQEIDLMNIHLFHDDINTLAIQEAPSVYSRDRLEALQFATRECSLSNEVPAILFGDFNVRLDKDFVEWLQTDFMKEKTNNNSDANLEDFLEIKDKSFSLKFCHRLVEPQRIQEVRKFDREINRFNEAQKIQLYEFPITFGFTYCLENHGELMMEKPINFVKRIPAWCDRILFTEPTKKLLSNKSVYSSICGIKSTGDHTPVYLYFQFET